MKTILIILTLAYTLSLTSCASSSFKDSDCYALWLLATGHFGDDDSRY